MGLSINTYPYTGGDPVFPVSFALGYLSRADIQVRVNNETVAGEPLYRDFIWVDDNNIRVPSDLSVGDNVTIQRTVSPEDLFVSFVSGDDITKYNLDAQARQALMLYQEFADGRSDIAGFNDIVEQLKQAVDAQIADTTRSEGILNAIRTEYAGQSLPSTVSNITALSTTTVSPLFTFITVGNARYGRVAEDPEHIYSGQDAEGQWWEINELQYISNMAIDSEEVPSDKRVLHHVYANSTTDVFGPKDTVSILAEIARKQNRPFVCVEDFDVRVRFDPVHEAFAKEDDDEEIYAELPVALRTAASLAEYRQARENHNALHKAMFWANSTWSLGKGNVILFYEIFDLNDPTVTNKSYRPVPVYGKNRIGDGNGQKLFMESRVVTNTVIDVQFSKIENDPRNQAGQNAIYRATVTYANPWGDHVVVGKSVSNRGVSGATRAEDGVSCINGSYEILTINADKTVLTFDVWNPREQTPGADPVPLPANPNLGTVTVVGIPANTALVTDLQICPVGGWNGKGFEGYISFERGAMFRWRGVGMTDWTHIDNNSLWDSSNPTGFTGDRKLLYMGHDVHGILEANCTFAGGEGAAIRCFGGNTLYSVHTIMGGLARNHLTEVGYRIQQNTSGQLIRTTTSGYTFRGIELGNSCTFSVHSCGFFGSNYGAYAIINSCISTNSALFMYCNRLLYSQSIVEMTVGTRLYSGQWAMSWDGGEFRGSPQLDGNVFDTLGNVGPGEYFRGGWWRNIPSLNPPTPQIFIPGARITGRDIAFQSGFTLSTDVTDRYRFTFNASRQQDFVIIVTPRDENVKNWKFEYVSTTGFDVFLYDADGNVMDADFTLAIANLRAQ